MDTPLDIERQKLAEWKEAQMCAMRDYCERDCEEHNENCFYYDAEEESYDYEQCYKDRGDWV